MFKAMNRSGNAARSRRTPTTARSARTDREDHAEHEDEAWRSATRADGERRVAVLRFGLGSVAYLVVLLLSFISPVATLVSAGVLAGYYVFQRTPGAPGDEPGI